MGVAGVARAEKVCGYVDGTTDNTCLLLKPAHPCPQFLPEFVSYQVTTDGHDKVYFVSSNSPDVGSSNTYLLNAKNRVELAKAYENKSHICLEAK